MGGSWHVPDGVVKYQKQLRESSKKYDYIIVGAGSAGFELNLAGRCL